MKWVKYLFITTLAVIYGTLTSYAMLEKQTISPKAKRIGSHQRNKFFITYTAESASLHSTTKDTVIDEKTGKKVVYIKPMNLGKVKEYEGSIVAHPQVKRQHLYAITMDGKRHTVGVMDHRLSKKTTSMRVWHSLPENLDNYHRVMLERLVLDDAYNAQATRITAVDLNTDEISVIELKENR